MADSGFYVCPNSAIWVVYITVSLLQESKWLFEDLYSVNLISKQ